MALLRSDFNGASCVALFNKPWACVQIYKVNYAASVDALNDSVTGFTAFKECDLSKHSNASDIRTRCWSEQLLLRLFFALVQLANNRVCSTLARANVCDFLSSFHFPSHFRLDKRNVSDWSATDDFGGT